MYMYFDSFDHFILGDRDDRLVSFCYPIDYASVVILGHIFVSFVEVNPQESVFLEVGHFHQPESLVEYFEIIPILVERFLGDFASAVIVGYIPILLSCLGHSSFIEFFRAYLFISDSHYHRFDIYGHYSSICSGASPFHSDFHHHRLVIYGHSIQILTTIDLTSMGILFHD